MRYIKTGKCIWCGKQEPEVFFDAAPHIVPHNLGSADIGFDVCNDCNHYFGKATRGVPSCDLAFKEIFNAFWVFGNHLDENTYKRFSSVFFSYFHSKHTIRIKRNFDSRAITRQFKRSLYEVFLQKYHQVTGNGNHPMFEMVRQFARYNIGFPHVFYVFNNIILCPAEEQRLEIPMNDNVIDEMMESGLYCFWMGSQLFYIEVLPMAFEANGYNYLRKQAQTVLIPAHGNERIFEFTDVMQLDFFMQRFNSKA